MGKITIIECVHCNGEIKITFESKPKKAIIQDQKFAGEIHSSFPVIGGTKEWLLPCSQVTKWKTLFPGLEVEHELKVALSWCEANPQRRKTARGMPRFLLSWLTRANDKPRSQGLRTEEEMLKELQ